MLAGRLNQLTGETLADRVATLFLIMGHAPSKVAARLAALKGRLLELEHDESMVED